MQCNRRSQGAMVANLCELPNSSSLLFAEQRSTCSWGWWTRVGSVLISAPVLLDAMLVLVPRAGYCSGATSPRHLSARVFLVSSGPARSCASASFEKRRLSEPVLTGPNDAFVPCSDARYAVAPEFSQNQRVHRGNVRRAVLGACCCSRHPFHPSLAPPSSSPSPPPPPPSLLSPPPRPSCPSCPFHDVYPSP